MTPTPPQWTAPSWARWIVALLVLAMGLLALFGDPNNFKTAVGVGLIAAAVGVVVL